MPRSSAAGFFTFCIILSLSSSLVYAEWTTVNLPFSLFESYLSDIYFISPDEGWAVGTLLTTNIRGQILHYENGSWTETNFEYPDPPRWWGLSRVHFISANEGWAVGNSQGGGVILHYFNGTWTAVTPPEVTSPRFPVEQVTGWNLEGVYFINSNEGWAVGGAQDTGYNVFGVLLHYYNGNWSSVSLPLAGSSSGWQFSDVYFSSPNEGWVIGNYDTVPAAEGILYHYYNGDWTEIYDGHWHEMDLPPISDFQYLAFSSIQFLSPDEGWILGGADSGDTGMNMTPVILQYNNGSWQIIHPNYPGGFGPVNGFFVSQENAWFVGNSVPIGGGIIQEGIILHYMNGDWTTAQLPYISTWWYLSRVFFPSPNEGWAVGTDVEGSKGVLLKYDVPLETISPPSTPSGPTFGKTGLNYTYTTGGSSSNLGNPVEYQFDWKGDGATDLSSWASATQSKTWSAPGTYNVKTRARCTQDTSVISSWSGALSVSISSNPTLTVFKSGAGNGTVTSSPAGINCGTNCTENVKPGKKITLKAKADSNSIFTGWSGGGCSGIGTCVVVMNADTAVTAAFSTKVPAISLSPSSLDFGSVKIKRSLKKILKIANNGTGDLKITLEGLAGSDFIIAGSTSVTVKPNKTYNLSITFKPSSAGNKTATLTVNSNDPNAQTVSVPLSGMGM